MSLDHSDVVDAVGFEQQTGVVVLSIVDSWDWDDESRHLIALQQKLNSYFEFIESGQIHESYPDSDGRPVRIDIIGKNPVPTAGLSFLEKAAEVASQLDVTLAYKLHPASA